MQEQKADNIGVQDGMCTDADRFFVASATEA